MRDRLKSRFDDAEKVYYIKTRSQIRRHKRELRRLNNKINKLKNNNKNTLNNN